MLFNWAPKVPNTIRDAEMADLSRRAQKANTLRGACCAGGVFCGCGTGCQCTCADCRCNRGQ